MWLVMVDWYIMMKNMFCLFLIVEWFFIGVFVGVGFVFENRLFVMF